MTRNYAFDLSIDVNNMSIDTNNNVWPMQVSILTTTCDRLAMIDTLIPAPKRRDIGLMYTVPDDSVCYKHILTIIFEIAMSNIVS